MEIVVIAMVLVILLVAVDIFATHKYSQQRRAVKNVASKPLSRSAKTGRNRIGTYY